MKARVNARWQNQESKYGFAGTVTEEDTTSNYLRGYNDENLPRFTAGVNVVGKFELFGRSHDVFVGVNYENFIDSKKFISAYYLVKFGNPSTVEDFEVPYANLDRTKMKICQGGVYAQLRLALLNNLLVNVGGRISSVCASMYDFERLDWVEAVKEECRITPLLGIAYDPVSYLTLYASYSTLFVPQTEKKDDGSILKPRIGYQVELGFKSGFCDNHITANMALFYLQDKDRAYKVSPKPTYVNAGKVENKGVELAINLTPVQTRDWRWDIGFNFAKNKNKVLSLPESIEGGRVSIYGFSTSATYDTVEMYAMEGKPIGQFFAYLPQYTEDGQMIVDANGYPVMGTALEDTGKNMNNDWTGGITTGLTFKDFTLSAALDIRKGGYMFSRTKNLMQFTGNGVVTMYNNRRPFVIPNSVVDNGDGTYSPNTTPIYLFNSSYQEYFNSYGYGYGGEAYLLDRSFVKLRNISLTWNVPKKWVRAMQLSDLSLTVFCNNVFTWTASDNRYIDPETTTVSQASYGDLATQFGEMYSNPSCRVFGCNLNITF